MPTILCVEDSTFRLSHLIRWLSHNFATLLPDGQVEVDGIAYASPSDAASMLAGKRTGGWWFFLTDQASRTSLRKIRRDYVNAMAVDEEDDEPDDDDDEG
jgi:hypothetical protein